MRVVEKKNEAAQPMLDYGWVVNQEDRDFTVRTPLGLLRAERAVGCLVQPNPGDMTLLSVDENGLCFILSVLRRG